MLYSILLSAVLLASGLVETGAAEATDTLSAVTVVADRGVVVSRKDTIPFINSESVPQMLRRSSGVHIGDYGGLSGLKNVSLRGLGSAHTAIYLDGVRVGNVQSGQNDLSMLGGVTLASAVVDYAQNSISFNTARPVFGKAPVSAKVSVRGGSFSTLMPSARLDFRLSDRLSLSAHADAVTYKGNYEYGDGKLRQNNDLRQFRGGLDLFGIMEGGEYHVKAWYNDAERGTPGSISWPSEDRQADRNAFIQAVARKRFTSAYTLDVSAKAALDDIHYSSAWGDSDYSQTEYQLNSSHRFRVNEHLLLCLSADLAQDGLKSSVYEASRFSVLGVLSAAYRSSRFAADLALEYTGAFDRGQESRTAFSPSLSLRYDLAQGLSLIAFGRRAYRIPTFNELYYVGYGNPSLRCEDAWMMDAGADWRRNIGFFEVRARIDGYHNILSDKISSAPTPEDPNIWMPYNIGRVVSDGVDLSAGTAYDRDLWKGSFDLRYSFQSAIDRTPDSYSYGQQIAYVSRHCLVMDASISYAGWELRPLWQLHAGRKDSYGDMPDWNTLDLSLAKSFSLKGGSKIGFLLTLRNAFDCRYEIVSGYPTEGRSFIAGLTYSF